MRTILERQERQRQQEDKRTFKTTEAARYLGLKKYIFARIIESGELPFRAIGRIRLFTRDNLDAWLRFEPKEKEK